MEGMGLEDELSEMYRWAITVGFGSLRPWTSDFFNRFPQVPQFSDWSVAEKSIFTNLLYYRANYIAMVMLAFTVAMFWNPLLLFGLILCVMISLVVLKLPVRALPPAVQRYAMHVRSLKQRLVAASVLSLLLLALLGCMTSLIWVLLLTLVFVLAHAALRPVKRTAEMHEMLARLNVKWTSADGAAPSADVEGGVARGGFGGDVHDGDVRHRAASGGEHNMVASGTPVALKGKVGSGAVQGGAPMAGGALPRPGGAKQNDSSHRRSGAAVKSD